MTPRHRARLVVAGLAVLQMLMAGCATPLGPGYDLGRETVTVHYVDRPVAPAVYYSVQVTARNTGNRPLDVLRIHAPGRAARQAQPSETPSERTSTTTSGISGRNDVVPVSLQPPLSRGQSRQIHFASIIPVGAGSVFLEPDEWFPSFLPLSGLFAEGESRAPKTEADIYVPIGDRALTTGRLRRVHTARPAGETKYAYEIRRQDFSPFLLIGKFDEQRIIVHGRSVLFWTRDPVDSRCARMLADEAVSTTELYRSVFGQLVSDRQPIRMIQTPAGEPSSAPSPEDAAYDAAGSIPVGVLFSEAPVDACRQPDRFLYLAARSLAATWFGWAVRPEPNAQAVLGDGVLDYAALLAEEKHDGAGARKRQVTNWLAEYDRLSSRTQPLTPTNLDAHSTPDQSRMAGVQSALFFVALEDRFGAEPVRRALRNLVESLRGGAAGHDELRSALERETGGDLSGFFDRWLGQAGIPQAFRQRYMAANPKSDFDADLNSRPRSGR